MSAVWWGGLAGGAGGGWLGEAVSGKNVTLVVTADGQARGGHVGLWSKGASVRPAARGLKAPWGAALGEGLDRV